MPTKIFTKRQLIDFILSNKLTATFTNGCYDYDYDGSDKEEATHKINKRLLIYAIDQRKASTYEVTLLESKPNQPLTFDLEELDGAIEINLTLNSKRAA